MEEARCIILLVTNKLKEDSFFAELLKRQIIDYKDAATRKSYFIKEMDSAVSENNKTFRNWIDTNRRSDTTAYEKAIIWIDHARDFSNARLKFSGKQCNLFISSQFLREGKSADHRSQFCYLINWRDLQNMSKEEIEITVNEWLQCLKTYFGK